MQDGCSPIPPLRRSWGAGIVKEFGPDDTRMSAASCPEARPENYLSAFPSPSEVSGQVRPRPPNGGLADPCIEAALRQKRTFALLLRKNSIGPTAAKPFSGRRTKWRKLDLAYALAPAGLTYARSHV